MQFLRFCMVGGIVFGFAAILLLMLTHVFDLTPELGRAISFPFEVTLAWYLNRRITFYSRSILWLRELRDYFLSNMFGLLVSLVGYYLVLQFIPEFAFYELVALAVGAGFGLVFNFALAKWWVFRRADS